MAVRLERRAVRDLRAARDWYNERATGVGTRLVLEFEAVMGEVESAPLAFQIIEGEVRRAPVLRRRSARRVTSSVSLLATRNLCLRLSQRT